MFYGYNALFLYKCTIVVDTETPVCYKKRVVVFGTGPVPFRKTTSKRGAVMKKNLAVLALTIVFAVSLLAGNAAAQEMTIDLGKMNPQLAQQVLADAKKQREEAEKTPEKPLVTASEARQWAEVGEQIASGVAATAKALSVEANEFIKTPVGKLTFFLIAWHFVGETLWSIVGGVAIWVILGSIILWSFKSFHLPKTVYTVDENGKKVGKTTVQYEFKTTETRLWSVIMHVAFFAALSITMIFIVL